MGIETVVERDRIAYFRGDRRTVSRSNYRKRRRRRIRTYRSIHGFMMYYYILSRVRIVRSPFFSFSSFFVRLSFEMHSIPSSSKRGDDESTIIVFSGEKERKRVFPFDYRVGKDIGDRIGSRSARDPEVIEGNTIPGTGYPVYKKKSVMVSDTRGNKSFLAVRMRKTSLLSLSLFLSSPNVAPLDTCHTRTVSVCRHSCRARISRRRNIDLRYTTKRVHLSWWETKPHGFVCSTFLLTFPSLSLRLSFPTTKSFHQILLRRFLLLLLLLLLLPKRRTTPAQLSRKFLARAWKPCPERGETCQGQGMLGISPHFGRTGAIKASDQKLLPKREG